MKKTVRLTEKELINVIKRVLNEQLLGLGRISSAGRSGFNLSKSSGRTGSRMRTPEADDAISDPTCSTENIKNMIYSCVKEKSKYTPTQRSISISTQLYKQMKGLSIGSNTINIFKQIKDNDEFCRVAANFKFENEDLYQWIDGEFLDPQILWQTLKTKTSPYFFDSCRALDPTYVMAT